MTKFTKHKPKEKQRKHAQDESFSNIKHEIAINQMPQKILKNEGNPTNKKRFSNPINKIKQEPKVSNIFF